MTPYRSILSFLLAIVAVFVVSCSAPTAAKPPSYTVAQIEIFQRSLNDLQQLRDRMGELPSLIQKRDWVNVGSLIHGPLGELRQKMLYLTTNLRSSEQKAAREAAREVFGHIEKIDFAAQTGNYDLAVQNYREAMKDFEAFLAKIPQA